MPRTKFLLATMTELTRLIFFMNNIHDTIKFTFEHSSNTINFLDITINIKNEKIMTTIHRKPTDKMLLLHFQSNHSLIHTTESIIYSQALRYNLIINTDIQLQIELYNLTRTLLARKYPLHIINHNKLKTLKFSRHDILHKTKKQKKPHFIPYGIYERDWEL